eukprot:1232734-Karenia_brevis.AAC.1
MVMRDGEMKACDMAPDQSLLEHFKRRDDGQITPLELLSIALGISIFKQEIRHSNIILYSDNVGAEEMTAK